MTTVMSFQRDPWMHGDAAGRQLLGLPSPHSDGCNAWYEMLPLPPASTVLLGEQRADWVVLGAGLAGLAAARRLAELHPQSSIALVEASRVGFGTAGRNSGFMIDLPHDLRSHSYTGDCQVDRDQIRLNRAAIDWLRQIVRKHEIACDWQERGKLHGAAEPQGVADLEDFARGLDALGEPYTALDGRDMARITGSPFYCGGLHAPGCVLVQPAALVRGLGASLPENVRLFEESPIQTLEIGSPHRLITRQGALTTPRLILATNAYASRLPGLGLSGRMLPIYTFASMTRPLDACEATRLGGDPCWGLVPADPMGTTVRRLGNGRICIRNSFRYRPSLKADAAVLRRVREIHQRSFQRRFPMLDGVEMTHTWGGALCLSRNGGAPFGELAPGLYSALCQNGLGLTRGTLAGKSIAELASGVDSDVLALLLKQPRPCRNPPEPWLGLGVRSTLAWKEWQAGIER